jgi:GNAT superfamily N-acetyltransferase
MCEHNKGKVRKFNCGDLAEVRKLIHRTIDACYIDDYCSEAIEFFKDWHRDERILQDAEDGYTIIIEEKGLVVGTGTIVGDEIKRVFVEPAYQGRGYGRWIMNVLEEKAVSLGINVVKLDASIPSKEFYDALDYATVHEAFLEVANNKKLDYYKMEKALMKERL